MQPEAKKKPPPPIFDLDAQPTRRLDKILLQPRPAKELVIFFTPRSGSTWLSDVMQKSGLFGQVSEAFNPNFIGKRAEKLGISNIRDYAEVAARIFGNERIFAFEVTAHQIRRSFGKGGVFFAAFPSEVSSWLIRRDIVGQAISLSKMVSTQLSHSPSATAESRAAADARFDYNPEDIKKWVSHILLAERLTEDWIDDYGLNPLRMCYEQTTRLTPDIMVRLMARHAGMDCGTLPAFEPAHEKLASAKNLAFAERFQTEEAEWLKAVEDERAVWLAKLDDLNAMAAKL